MALGSRMDLDNPCLLSMSVVLVTMWLLAVAQLVDTHTLYQYLLASSPHPGPTATVAVTWVQC